MKKHIIIIVAFICIVSNVTAQITLPELPKRAKSVDYSMKETGYWIAAEFSGAFATNSHHQSAVLQLGIINGYRFSEFLKIGIGVTPRYYFNAIPDFCGKNGKPFSLPIYLDIRGNITPQADAMFAFCWSTDLGYSINEGIYASPCIGIRAGGIRHNFLANLYYTFQGHNVINSTEPIHLIGLRLGYEF